MTIEDALKMPLDKVSQSTFDNRNINLLNMSHSHLSNCYWYSLFFQNKNILKAFDEQMETIKKRKFEVVRAQDYERAVQIRDAEKELMLQQEHFKVFPLNEYMTPTSHMLYRRALEERFNGEILPYTPHPDFESEITGLMEMKMLISTSTGYDIYYNEIKIGEVKIL